MSKESWIVFEINCPGFPVHFQMSDRPMTDEEVSDLMEVASGYEIDLSEWGLSVRCRFCISLSYMSVETKEDAEKILETARKEGKIWGDSPQYG